MHVSEMVFYSLIVGGIVGMIAIIWSYAKGLKGTPREMWIMLTSKVLEYTAYAAINMALTLWLTRDCGMGDVATGAYIMSWSVMLSVMNMIAGAIADTIGLKKTMILSAGFLIFSRIIMTFSTNPVLVFIFGFIPLAIGFAIVLPTVSIAIKRFTTKEQAAMGFGLFYVVMNLAYAFGGVYFDKVREMFSEVNEAGKIINENAGTMFFGHHFSTYQLFFLFGVAFTIASLLVLFFMREGVDRQDDGEVTVTPLKDHGSGLKALKSSAIDTVKMLKTVVVEKHFWIFIVMIGTTIFVRFIFFHFHYTFPKYGIRVLGEGAKIGAVYGVLNPVLVIYMTPIVAYFTKKISSYRMLIVGSIVSSVSCFIAVIPAEVFSWMTDSMLGELIFVNWLGLADNASQLAGLVDNHHIAAYWPLIVFITVFTFGEAIWSPRLMQFTAEIAPKGKEGTYIGLSVLPWFAAKFVVGPMSGILLNNYVPVDEDGNAASFYANHQMVWVWIGGMALLTPVALLVLRNMFNDKLAQDEAEAAEADI